MEDIELDYEENLSVTVRVIENGYLVECYRKGKYETWYCINTQEVMQKLDKFI